MNPSPFLCVSSRLRRLITLPAICLINGLAGYAADCCAAPGEDPIVIQVRVNAPIGPALAQARSTPMTPPAVTPAWLEAKVARLEAKAWAFDTGNLITDKNLLAAANSDGIRKLCVQDIGSALSAGANSAAGSGALRNTEPQIVVLKGDVVNICR